MDVVGVHGFHSFHSEELTGTSEETTFPIRSLHGLMRRLIAAIAKDVRGI